MKKVDMFKTMSFGAFLDEKVKTHPDRVFVSDKTGQWTWRGINAGAQALAKNLYAAGVRKGSHVSLCGRDSAHWIMAFFAIQKLGALALLINSKQTVRAIGEISAAGDAEYIVLCGISEAEDRDSRQIMADYASLSTDRIYVIDDEKPVTDDGIKPGVENAKVLPDDVAVMIFTSGTTGTVKGVLHSAYNILSAACNSSVDQRLDDNDRMCLILPMFHIFGLVAGLFSSAVADAKLYIPVNMHTNGIIDCIHSNRCTVFHCVPTMLLAIMGNKDFSPGKLSALRCTIISGAAATQHQMKMFRQALPGDTFLSSYGLSEMAPVSITSFDDDDDTVSSTVGHPAKGISIRICDHITGKECPPKTSGEIVVKDDRLMTAYYRTSIDDQPIDGDGWLHTGDIGWIDEKGYIHLSGRIKDIIIRGGENIMPIWVENGISSLDEVANVKVFGIKDDFYGETVAAAVILKEGAKADEETIRKKLDGRIAKYMIPSHIEFFDEFPTLASGKPDLVNLKDLLVKRTLKAKTDQITSTGL